MFRIAPQLTVRDLARSQAFYEKLLGFAATVVDPPDDPVFISLERDDATLFLVSDASREEAEQRSRLTSNRRGVGVRLYLEVDDARALYEDLRAGDVRIVREIAYNEKEDYTEFSVEDPDGYEIGVYS